MPEPCLNGSSLCFPLSALGHFGKGGHVMNINLAISKLHRSLRSVSLRFTRRVRSVLMPLLIRTELMDLFTDPPIKRFAQRHTYLGTDAIAARDLGFAMAGRQPAGASSSTSFLEKHTDSLLSITSAAHMPPTQPPAKRQPSPELKRREESVKPEFAPPAKRPRPMSPPRDRERDRFADGPRRRFGSPAAWEKDRDREPQHPVRREPDDKSTTFPAVLSWFVGQLPNPASFDGQFYLRSIIVNEN